jgi:hypothetical protein
MSCQRSLITIIISIIFFQFLFIHSTPIISETNHIIEENDDDYQRTYNTFMYFIKTILDESNPNERPMLLNQLREYLNRMCIVGYFGPTHADACQRVADSIHQTYMNNHLNDDDNSDTSNEPHGIQKRLFCNGFIGCKSLSG